MDDGRLIFIGLFWVVVGGGCFILVSSGCWWRVVLGSCGVLWVVVGGGEFILVMVGGGWYFSDGGG